MGLDALGEGGVGGGCRAPFPGGEGQGVVDEMGADDGEVAESGEGVGDEDGAAAVQVVVEGGGSLVAEPFGVASWLGDDDDVAGVERLGLKVDERGDVEASVGLERVGDGSGPVGVVLPDGDSGQAVVGELGDALGDELLTHLFG